MGYWEAFYHFVWTTKNRFPYLQGDVEKLIDRRLREFADEAGVMIRALGYMDDHVHMAVSIPPSVYIPKFMQDIKSRSTYALNRSGLLSKETTFSWQREYGVFTFGRNSLDDVVEYVKNQRIHHANGTIRRYFEITDSRDAPSVRPYNEP